MSSLKELRFHLCQSNTASTALRSFLSNNYPSLKKAFNIPILVREASNIKPSFTARFEKGREIKKTLDGLSEKEIQKTLKELLKPE